MQNRRRLSVMARWLSVVLLLVGPLWGRPPAYGATRLGLHVTQEELTIWRARMTDNVNTINGFTYQSIYQNRILAQANQFVGESHPGGDGYWTGNTSGTCQPPESFSFGPGRESGELMFKAAFVYLLTGNTSYAAGVKANLLAMANLSTINFANTSLFCIPSGYQNGVEIQNWATRVILSYDYLLAGGYTGLTTGEKTQIQTWLTGLVNWFLGSLHWGSDNGFYSYNGLFNTPPSLACSNNCTVNQQPWYYQGHATAAAGELWNSVSAGVIEQAMLVGVMTNNATMIQDAKNWITGFIPLAINNIGATPMLRRWQDCSPPCIGSAWSHAGSVMGSYIQAVDTLARTGDGSLYNLSVATQVPGSPAGTVSLSLMMLKLARLANKTQPLYSYEGSTQSTQISWDVDGPPGNYHDFIGMVSNVYYKNAEMRTAMTRNTLAANSSTAGCGDASTGGCFTGAGAARWPDLPFMLGNLDNNQINPYGLTAPTDPTVTITAPASGTYTTNVSPLTTLAGTATDDVGVTGLTWSCPTCTPTSGTICPGAQCGGSSTARTWSVPSIGLTEGQNVLTVTVTDGTTPVSTALTVTYGPLITVDSNYNGYTPASINDGVIDPNGLAATTWSSDDTAVDHWVLFDFGTARLINSVTVWWAFDSPTSAYAASHQMLVQSWNGAAYVTQATIANATMVASNTANLSPISTTRIRLYQVAGQGSNAWPNLIWLTEVDYTVASGGQAAPTMLRVLR
jgi:hypothetical protein